MPNKNKAVDDELKRLIIDCTYTARGHQSAGQVWADIHDILGVPFSILSAISGLGSAASALTENTTNAAILAVLSVGLSATSTFLRPDERSNAHLSKARPFLTLRNEVRIYREVGLQRNPSVSDMEEKLLGFRAKYSELGKLEPLNIPRWAYWLAKRSISKGESSYENDPLWKELDR